MATKKLSAKRWKVSVYLAKSHVVNDEACIRSGATYQSQAVGKGRGKVGTLFYRKTPSHPPEWTGFFGDLLDQSQFKASSVSAVLIAKARGKTFALTFGYGRSLLEPGAFEEDFGLKACLNSISAGGISSVDRATLEAQGRHGREQSSQPSSISEFGLDVEQDILRAVSGQPELVELGSRISGHDALVANPRINANSVGKFLELALNQYRKRRYKEDFPWVDHIQEVANPDTKRELDELLTVRLENNELEKIWMAVPEVIDWSTISAFAYSLGANAKTFDDIRVPDFIASLRSVEKLRDKIRSRKVFALRLDSEQVEKSWTVYRCLYAEISLQGRLFLLNNGKWYEVEPNFRRTVNRSVAQIRENPNLALSSYSDPDEASYLERVASKSKRMALMDKKNIPFGGGASRIEFCDLFESRRILIHVKRYGGSSVLSHLFKQGLVSGTLFCSDADFRVLVNKYLPTTHRLSNPEANLDASMYEIAFAIVSNVPGKLNLPFFSQVALRSTYRQLTAYGYAVTLNKIETKI